MISTIIKGRKNCGS